VAPDVALLVVESGGHPRDLVALAKQRWINYEELKQELGRTSKAAVGAAFIITPHSVSPPLLGG
jgi:hypothetical protein